MGKHKSFRYFLFYKPYDVLCQFSAGNERKSIAHYGPFPKDVYPAGRLDADSEGLVLLTNDGRLKHFLLDPRYRHPRTYLAQIEGVPSDDALNTLRGGVVILKRKTLPAEIELLECEPKLPPRRVSIRFRRSVPTSWLQITLREGRNRQVRRMTAAVGHPTLRLVRVAIGSLNLEGLRPGASRELSAQEIDKLHRSVLRG